MLSRQLLSEKKATSPATSFFPLALNPREVKTRRTCTPSYELAEAKKVDEAYKALVQEMDREEAESKKDD